MIKRCSIIGHWEICSVKFEDSYIHHSTQVSVSHYDKQRTQKVMKYTIDLHANKSNMNEKSTLLNIS